MPKVSLHKKFTDGLGVVLVHSQPLSLRQPPFSLLAWATSPSVCLSARENRASASLDLIGSKYVLSCFCCIFDAE